MGQKVRLGKHDSRSRVIPVNHARTALEEWTARQRISGKPLSQDEDVWIALEFIASSLGTTFCVSDVVSAVCTNRRTLERQFLKVAGCTIGKAISEIRTQAGAVLLRKTDMSVTLVGTHVGINSVAQFSRQFRKVFNQTPTEYARLHRVKPDCLESAG